MIYKGILKFLSLFGSANINTPYYIHTKHLYHKDNIIHKLPLSLILKTRGRESQTFHTKNHISFKNLTRKLF